MPSVNGAVTEWLRCTIRNRLGSSRVGSSPASIDQNLLWNLFSLGTLSLLSSCNSSKFV